MSDLGPPIPEEPIEKPRRRSLLFDITQVMAGRGAHIGFNIAAGIATSRIWGAEAVGLIALAMWAPSLLTRVLFLGLSKSIPYAIGRKLASMDEIIGTLVSIWFLLSIFGVVVGMAYVMSPLSGQNIPMLWAILGVSTMPISIISTYARGVAMGVERMDFMLRFHWLRDPVLFLTIIVGGVFLGCSDPECGWIRLLGHILTYVAGVALGIHLIRQYASMRPRWHRGIAKFMWQMSIKFGLGVCMMILNYRISLFLLNLPIFNITEAEIGNFSRAESIAMLLWQIPGALGVVLFSRGVNEEANEAVARRAMMIARVSIVMCVPIAIVMYAVSPWIVPAVYGKDFVEAGKIAQILIPGVLVFFAARTFEADLAARGKPITVSLTMLPVTTFNIIFSLFLIGDHGAQGAAVANTVAYTLGTVFLGVVYAKVTGVPVRELVAFRRSDFSFIEKRIAGRLRRGRKSRGE